MNTMIWFSLLGICSLLLSCATTKPLPPLAVLNNGVTPRAMIVESLGYPSMSLEHGRIMTFRMRYSEKQNRYQIVTRSGSGHAGQAGWANADISLVLVFNENDRLEQHSIVRVK